MFCFDCFIFREGNICGIARCVLWLLGGVIVGVPVLCFFRFIDSNLMYYLCEIVLSSVLSVTLEAYLLYFFQFIGVYQLRTFAIRNRRYFSAFLRSFLSVVILIY